MARSGATIRPIDSNPRLSSSSKASKSSLSTSITATTSSPLMAGYDNLGIGLRRTSNMTGKRCTSGTTSVWALAQAVPQTPYPSQCCSKPPVPGMVRAANNHPLRYRNQPKRNKASPPSATQSHWPKLLPHCLRHRPDSSSAPPSARKLYSCPLLLIFSLSSIFLK